MKLSSKFIISILMMSILCTTSFSASSSSNDCEINIYAKFEKPVLDPLYAVTWWDKKFVSLTYDTLIKFDENGTLYPGLASKWVIDKTQKKLKLTLKDNIRFHDGTIITAQQVAQVLQRIKNTKNPDQHRLKSLISITSIGSKEIQLTYTAITPYDIYLLATPRFSIYKPDASHIGTGLWMHTEQLGEKFSFTSTFLNKGRDACKNLFAYNIQLSDALMRLKDGRLDIIEYVTLSQEENKKIETEFKALANIYKFKRLDTTILFHSNLNKVQDQNKDMFRLKLLQTLYRNPGLILNSTDTLAANIIPPGVDASFKQIVQTNEHSNLNQNTKSYIIYVPDSAEYKGHLIPNLSRIIKKAGINAEVKSVSLKELYSLHAKGKVSYHVETITLQTPHPYGILSMFQSGSGENFTNYQDARTDQLLSMGLKDEKNDNHFFTEASHRIIASGYATPLVHQVKSMIISKKLKGYNFSKISPYNEYYSNLNKRK